jgi:hypothetical protein
VKEELVYLGVAPFSLYVFSYTVLSLSSLIYLGKIE